jgi:hypothetical protein
VKWNVVVADAKRGYWSTNAPLVIRNHVLVGVSGDFDNLPGILQSFDPRAARISGPSTARRRSARRSRAAARPAVRCG